jgi:hypothetical protein
MRDFKESVVSLTDFARTAKQHSKELAYGGRANSALAETKIAVIQ